MKTSLLLTPLVACGVMLLASCITLEPGGRAVTTAVDMPDEFKVGVGGYLSEGFSVRREKDYLVYSHTIPGNSRTRKKKVHPSADQWASFWTEMDRLQIWQWLADYKPPANIQICDGTVWGITIAYKGKIIESRGDNAYPSIPDPKMPVIEGDDRFHAFCAAVKTLLGGEEFH